MNGLREKIVAHLKRHLDYDIDEGREIADAILDLPEIQEALKINYLVKAGAIVDAGTKV